MLSSTGAVLGIDVGYSTRRKSSAVCRLDWDANRVTWHADRFCAVEPKQLEKIISVAGKVSLACAAFDGPLRSGLNTIGHYRTAERMLTRKLQRKMGKPGQSSSPVGKRLNAQANAYVAIVLASCDVAPASHEVRIDQRAVVEAFPSSFLGVMIDQPWQLNASRGNRSDRFFEHWSKCEIFDRLVEHLLPGRHLLDPTKLSNHDERAALVCALTALCVAANDYTAVGDHDGWIILPPYALLQPWAKKDLDANAREEDATTATLHMSRALPGKSS